MKVNIFIVDEGALVKEVVCMLRANSFMLEPSVSFTGSNALENHYLPVVKDFTMFLPSKWMSLHRSPQIHSLLPRILYKYVGTIHISALTKREQ